jgi:light-regulated signal transduction histidine kinase (bacteriophytochrome)
MFVVEGLIISLLAHALKNQARRADLAHQEARRNAESLKEMAATLERRVDERTTQLREANRELEAFTYSVSHDLRAPLRHIDGFAELLRRHLGDRVDDRAAHYVQVLEDTARNAGRLVDDLLAFSRMGRTELRRADADMNALLAEARAGTAEGAEGRHIEWLVPDLPRVKGDPILLRQVWQNLVENAVKFTRGRDPAHIEVGARTADDEVEFWVRDDGAGFDPRYGDKLFGVFQRLHRADEFEGTGIGLANVRRIVARHGGRCWAEGKPGEGATFHFTLPAAGPR